MRSYCNAQVGTSRPRSSRRLSSRWWEHVTRARERPSRCALVRAERRRARRHYLAVTRRLTKPSCQWPEASAAPPAASRLRTHRLPRSLSSSFGSMSSLWQDHPSPSKMTGARKTALWRVKGRVKVFQKKRRANRRQATGNGQFSERWRKRHVGDTAASENCPFCLFPFACRLFADGSVSALRGYRRVMVSIGA